MYSVHNANSFRLTKNNGFGERAFAQRERLYDFQRIFMTQCLETLQRILRNRGLGQHFRKHFF